MHDSRIYIDYSAGYLFPSHWLKCPDCNEHVGPYMTMGEARKKASSPRRCSDCWYKASMEKPHR